MDIATEAENKKGICVMMHYDNFDMNYNESTLASNLFLTSSILEVARFPKNSNC